jgi:hypothetical protein
MSRLFIPYVVPLLFQAQAIYAAAHFSAHFSDSTRSRRWYLPHYVPVQYAGNIGFFSTGLGYTSNKENYELNILYGYVPASIGNQYIHMITAKNIFPLTRIPSRNNQTIIPYLGLGLMAEVGGQAFFTLPSHYPDGYYDFPKNLHVIGFGGAKLQYLFQDDTTFLRGLEFYAEAGTIDVYVWYKVISEEIKFNEIFSLALGVNFLLDH